MTDCIRGCTWKNDQGEKMPRPAETGRLCSRTRDIPEKGCAERLRRALTDIVDQYEHLDADPSTTPRPTGGRVSRQKISGSPAGARLDVIVMRDLRSKNVVRPDGKHEPEDTNERQRASAPTILIELAEQAAGDLNLTTVPLRNLTDATGFLGGIWFKNICRLDWIDDLFDEVQELAATLRRLNGKGGQRPIGRCECGAAIYQPVPRRPTPGVTPTDDAVIECRDCGHRMNALALIRLAALQRSTVSEESA